MSEEIIKRGFFMPTICKLKIDNTNIEVCHGLIPEHFRTDNFGPITDFELPESSGRDDLFNVWIKEYRQSKTTRTNKHWLEIIQCS